MATVAPAHDLSDIGFKFGTYPKVGGDQAKPVHTIRVPKFESLEAERAHRKLHQAAALRWLGYNGYNNEGAGGHVTVRDPVMPDHFWYLCTSCNWAVSALTLSPDLTFPGLTRTANHSAKCDQKTCAS